MKLLHHLLITLRVPYWPVFIRKPLIKAFVARKKTTTLPFRTRTVTGVLYEGDAADLIDYHVLSRGGFEPGLSHFLKDWAQSGRADVFIDVGANSGLHSAFWARFYGRGHAFEPYQPIYKKLLRTFSLNAIENVTAHAIGLGAIDAECEFLEPDSGNCGTGRLAANRKPTQGRALTKVRVCRGDDILADETGCLSAIKVDVEGFEADVLSGLRGRIESDRPLIVFELLSEDPVVVSRICANIPEDYAYYQIENIKSSDYRLLPWASGIGDVVAIPEEASGFAKSLSRS